MIRKFILRILKLLIKTNILGRVITLKYTGTGLSLNTFYASNSWYTRQQAKNDYKGRFQSAINELSGITLNKFYVVIFYNSKHDVDNVVGMEKIVVDSLRESVVYGDQPEYYKGLCIFYDKALPFNTFEILIIEEK